jgi:hypothetical protein
MEGAGFGVGETKGRVGGKGKEIVLGSTPSLPSGNRASKRGARATQTKQRARRARLTRLLPIPILLLTQMLMLLLLILVMLMMITRTVFIPSSKPEPEPDPKQMRIKAQLARGAPKPRRLLALRRCRGRCSGCRGGERCGGDAVGKRAAAAAWLRWFRGRLRRWHVFMFVWACTSLAWRAAAASVHRVWTASAKTSCEKRDAGAEVIAVVVVARIRVTVVIGVVVVVVIVARRRAFAASMTTWRCRGGRSTATWCA